VFLAVAVSLPGSLAGFFERSYKGGSLQNPINHPVYNVAKIEAIINGATVEEAGKTAWKAYCNRKEHAVKINRLAANGAFIPVGLILDSGRKISWKIAELKLKSGELVFTAEEKQKFLAACQKLHINNTFTKLVK
jgi:hypothetical protein